MELDLWRTFVRVAEAKSITRASDALHLSQPTVSLQLKRLESALGAPLFHRRGRGVSLTAEGEALLPYARRLLATHAEALRRLADMAELTAGRVILGCGLTHALTWLPPVLGVFARRFPKIDIQLRVGASAEIARLAVGDDIDCGLLTTLPDLVELACEPLYTDAIVLVAPPGAPGRDLTERSPGAGATGGLPHGGVLDGPALADVLAGARLLTFGAGTGFRTFIEASLRSIGAWPERIVEVDSIEAIRRLVEEGVGVALVPRSAVQESLSARRLDAWALAGDGFPPGGLFRTTYLVRRADRYESRAVAELVAHLRQGARAAGAKDGW